MTKFRTISALAAIGALVLSVWIVLTGCQPTGPSVPLSVTESPLQHTNRIVILDRNVRNTLFLVNAVHQRLPGGQLLVRANFQNRFHQDDVWADVKFEFQDKYNMVVDETEWMPTYFPAGEVTMVQGSSISSGAAKHVLLLKGLRTAAGGRIRGPGSAIYVIR